MLLSSHLLHEIEVIADDLVVIGQGRIVAQGTKSDLLSAAGTVVRCQDAEQAGRLAAALTAAGHSAEPYDGNALRTDADPVAVGRRAHATDLTLTELRAADGAGLEEMFLELTADTQREGAAA